MLDYKKFLDKQMLREKFLDKQNFVKKLFDGNLLYQRIAIGCAAVLVLLLFTIALGGNPAGSPAASPGKVLYVQVKSGMTAGEIGDALQQKGVISSKYRFWLLAKLNGAESSFKAGNYAFHSQMEPRDVLGMLMQGSSLVVRFTIPEGYNVNEIAKYLSDKGIVSSREFLQAAKNFAPYDYMLKKPDAQYRSEGFLFPDTYEIRSDAGAEDILKLMAGEFDQKLTPELREQAEQNGLSVYELVTLASLVEKEARFEEDRPIIAQVFLKRLRIGMPLQSDTTIQYLLDAPKEDVSIADTKINSPYNTYQNMGLPPGPIANPGIASIRAVLYPADTDYLYFVADREGRNHYSNSYDEHLAIVDQVR